MYYENNLIAKRILKIIIFITIFLFYVFIDIYAPKDNIIYLILFRMIKSILIGIMSYLLWCSKSNCNSLKPFAKLSNLIFLCFIFFVDFIVLLGIELYMKKYIGVLGIILLWIVNIYIINKVK